MRKKRPTPLTRALLASMAGFLCEYCKCPKAFIPIPFDIEHILPISLGGTDDVENSAYACHGCNLIKNNKIEGTDPVNKVIVPFFHPRSDEWNDHFVWDESGLLMLGITPVGRATIESLKLNREAVVNLRSLLVLAGKHPPQL